MRNLSILALLGAGGAAWAASNTPVTFNKDVLPILRRIARDVIGPAKSRRCRS